MSEQNVVPNWAIPYPTIDVSRMAPPPVQVDVNGAVIFNEPSLRILDERVRQLVAEEGAKLKASLLVKEVYQQLERDIRLKTGMRRGEI